MSAFALKTVIELPSAVLGLILSVIASLIVLGAMTHISSSRQETDSGLVAHQYELLRGLDEVLSTMKDAETGQRGYVLTGDPTYLEPYHSALRAIEEQMAALVALTRGEPALKQPLAHMVLLTTAKMSELHDSIAANDAHGRNAAMTIILSGQGKQIMDQLRRTIAQIKTGEERILLDDLSKSRQQSRYGAIELTIWVPLALSVVGLLSMMLYRAFRDSNDRLYGRLKHGWSSSALGKYVLAIGITCIAAFLRLWIESVAGALPPYITFYPAVLAVAVVAGAGPAVFAVIVSALVADHFFIKPVGSFAIREVSDLAVLGIFVVTNLAVCMLADRFRIGISPALDLNQLSTLGVQLVTNLVEQLEGQLEIIRQPGSTYRITFPVESVA